MIIEGIMDEILPASVFITSEDPDFADLARELCILRLKMKITYAANTTYKS